MSMHRTLFLFITLCYTAGNQAQHANNIPLNEVPIHSEFPILMAEEMLKEMTHPVERSETLGMLAIANLNINHTEQAKDYFSSFKEECSKIKEDTTRAYTLIHFSNQLYPIITDEEMKSIGQETMTFLSPTNNDLRLELSKLYTHLNQFGQTIELLSGLHFKEGKYTWDSNRSIRETSNEIIIKMLQAKSHTSCAEKQVFLNQLSQLHLNDFRFTGGYKMHMAFDSLILHSVDDCSVTAILKMEETFQSLTSKSEVLRTPFNAYFEKGDTASMRVIVEKMESLTDDVSEYNYQLHLNDLFRYYLKIGDLQKAIDFEKNYPKNWFSGADHNIELATYLFEHSKSEEALKYLDQLKQNSVDDLHSWDGSRTLNVIKLYNKYGYPEQGTKMLNELRSNTLSINSSDYGRMYTLEKIIKYYASHGSYDTAIDLALNHLHNSGPSSPRSDALHETYLIAFAKEDTLEGLNILKQAVIELDNIEHPNQKKAFIEYAAVQYAKLGNYEEALRIGHKISSNIYFSIFDYIEGFFDAYTANRTSVLPEEYFQAMVSTISNEKNLQRNAHTITYLIAKYDSTHANFEGSWFETEMEQLILESDLPELTKEDRKEAPFPSSKRVDYNLHVFIDYIRYNLLYQLYDASGNETKKKEALQSATKQVHQREYSSQHVDWMIRIDKTYGRWGWWF